MRAFILIVSLGMAAGTCFGMSQTAKQDSIWTLQQCIEHAFSQNIQIRKSELSNQRFTYYADQAKAQRMPSANASVSQNFNWSKSTATGSTGFSGVNGSNYSVNSTVTIYNASRISSQIKQADMEIQSGQYSLEETKEVY